MDLHDLIVSNPDLLGGEPCFRGTRVPVATLFEVALITLNRRSRGPGFTPLGSIERWLRLSDG